MDLQHCVAHCIALLLEFMNAAVEFHDQLTFYTDKIGSVVADQVLATKLEAIKFAIAQVRPQQSFTIFWIAAHRPRSRSFARP